MNKRTLISTVFFLLFAGFACAAESKEEAKYIALYGKGLYDVPTVIRIAFQTETGLAWPDISQGERLKYLIQWDASKKQAIEARKSFIKEVAKTNMTYEEAKKERIKLAERRKRLEQEQIRQKTLEKRNRDKKIQEMKRKRDQIRERLRRLQENRSHHSK